MNTKVIEVLEEARHTAVRTQRLEQQRREAAARVADLGWELIQTADGMRPWVAKKLSATGANYSSYLGLNDLLRDITQRERQAERERLARGAREARAADNRESTDSLNEIEDSES